MRGKVVADAKGCLELGGVFDRAESVLARRLEQVEVCAKLTNCRGVTGAHPARARGIVLFARIIRRCHDILPNLAHPCGARIELKLDVVGHPFAVRPGRQPLSLMPTVHVHAGIIGFEEGRICSGKVVGRERARWRARLDGREPDISLRIPLWRAHARDRI
jgi:hypothetical protein